MAFDSTVMGAVAAELHEKLVHGRISKIYQPEGEEIALLIYAGGQNHRLLLCANARFARLHLSTVEKKNPPSPSTYCMLLRKYLEGGRILAVRQVERERICRIHIGVTDELGNPAEYVLVAEIMGKHSNLILIGPQGRIVDAIRRVTEEVNRHRELLPGLRYVPPPALHKLDPGAVSAAELADKLTIPAPAAWQFLLDQIDGLGPLLTKEAVFRAGFAPETPVTADMLPMLVASVHALVAERGWQPAILMDGSGRLKDYHALEITHWPWRKESGFASVNALLDGFYGRKEQEDRVAALKGSLAKLVRDEVGRVKRKLELQHEALTKAENAEAYRVQGELITANLWQIKSGDAEARVVNYYDPEGAEVLIPLDKALSPAENAQACYRRYQKAKSGKATIAELIAKHTTELQYLAQVEASLDEAASLPDLEEVRRELTAEGYIGEKKKERKGAAPKEQEHKPQPPHVVRSTDGLEIWVGRNNRQNDYLTMKLAAPHDIWFHTKEIAGAHVILRVPPGQAVPEQAIHEAGALAAWHSKGRGSSGVPVDYTLRKHIRKPNGARPGMVIYDHQKTLFVTPDPELNPILKREYGGAAHGTSAAAAADGDGD